MEPDISHFRLDTETRAALRSGERTKAANLLRQKKRAEKDLADKDTQYQRLLTMLHQLGSTKVCFSVFILYREIGSSHKMQIYYDRIFMNKCLSSQGDPYLTSIQYHNKKRFRLGREWKTGGCVCVKKRASFGPSVIERREKLETVKK